MNARRKIAVITATRAEYGLLYPLMNTLQAEPLIELQIIVTGTHLSPTHGRTVTSITDDGFSIDARIPMLLDDDSPQGVTKSLGLATIGFADAFERLKPDLIVLLGDRYEALAAAQAAMIARIPIAHIHGGEATEGLIDEAIRHSITKMAHLHFVAAPDFRRRVVQLGEQPDRVWVVGASALDNIQQLTLLDKLPLEASLGLPLRPPSFLVTYHPVTLRDEDAASGMRILLEVLAETGGSVVITGVNADTGGSSVRHEAQRVTKERHERFAMFESLGTLRYLSAMHHMDVVIGNSSSGLVEAPAIGTPSINIGERQQGRLLAPSVVQCEPTGPAIRAAITVALSTEHRAISAKRETPYGTPGAAHRIAEVLRSHPLEGILVKRFNDLPNMGLACP